MDRLGLLRPHPHVTLGLHILLRRCRLATTTNKTKNKGFVVEGLCEWFFWHPSVALPRSPPTIKGLCCFPGHPWISAIRTYLSPFTKDNRVLIHLWDFLNFCRAFRPAQQNQRKSDERKNIATPHATCHDRVLNCSFSHPFVVILTWHSASP